MYSYVERKEMEKQYDNDKPNLIGLNKGLTKATGKDADAIYNPMTEYVEKKAKEEFLQFLTYNEELKLTKKLQELNNQGVITINYQKQDEPVEEIFSEETKQKARVFFIGFGLGMLVAMMI